MSKLPKYICISIISNGKPLTKVLFYIIIISKHKNNYTLGPFLTDDSGKYNLSKEIVIKEIDIAMTEFPMDYSSHLEDCTNNIVIVIEGKETIEKKIQSLLKYYPVNAKTLISVYENSINSTFVSDFKIEMQINDRIEISLT